MICLAACQQPTRSPETELSSAERASSPTATQPPKPALAPVTSLSGAWRVAGIDGSSFNESYGLALTGDQDKLWWEPRCAGMARGYRIDGSSLSFTSLHPPRPPGAPTPPVCTIGLPPRLDEVFRALDAATSITRTPENGIQISGGRHSLTLFSQ
jgi:hypothetical protein